MSLGLTPAQIRLFLSLPPELQRKMIEEMGPAEVLALDAAFEVWARKGQRVPDGEGWRVWLMLAGRGFGKTRAGAEWVNRLAAKRGLRIALVAASIDEARSIMVEGASGILSVARAHNIKVKWEPSLKRLTWPSGSIAELYSGDNADSLRGPQHHFAWCVATDRRGARGGSRDGRGQHAAGQPGRRTMLHRRQRADRGMGGTGQGDRWLCRGRMAVRRGNCGNERARQGQRTDRDV